MAYTEASNLERRSHLPALRVGMALVLAVGCVAACSSSGQRRAQREPAPTKPREAPAQVVVDPLGPRTPQSTEPQAEADGKPAEAVPTVSAKPESAPAPPSTSQRVPNGGREDGRPNWWFAEVRSADGAVQLCAEALGVDMPAARDAALTTARARMRAQLALEEADPIPGERIERAWVWPLPNSRVGPSRYAGYVLISATAAGAD